jgi:hypothetical protein
MAELTAKLFRDYFGGSWLLNIAKNGDFQREIVLNWPEAFEKYSSLGTEEEFVVPPNSGPLDNTRQLAIAGWRSDVRRWVHTWHNEFGGFGELQWTSQEEVEGLTVLHGFIHECKQEGDDPTSHVIKCEMFDKNNFKYTISSFRKGLTEIVARRLKTSDELRILMEKQDQIKGDIEKLKNVITQEITTVKIKK